MINKNSKIFLAGHSGMIGSALLRKLEEKNSKKYIQSLKQLDLEIKKSI